MNLENPAGRNAVAYVIAVVVRNLLVAEHCSGVFFVKTVGDGILQRNFIGSGVHQPPQYLVVDIKFSIGFFLETVLHHIPVVMVFVATGIAAEFPVTTSFREDFASTLQAFRRRLSIIVFHSRFGVLPKDGMSCRSFQDIKADFCFFYEEISFFLCLFIFFIT